MKDDPSVQNGHAETQFEAEGSLAGFETLEKLLEVPLLHSQKCSDTDSAVIT